jgi:hypothetical protein
VRGAENIPPANSTLVSPAAVDKPPHPAKSRIVPAPVALDESTLELLSALRKPRQKPEKGGSGGNSLSENEVRGAPMSVQSPSVPEASPATTIVDASVAPSAEAFPSTGNEHPCSVPTEEALSMCDNSIATVMVVDVETPHDISSTMEDSLTGLDDSSFMEYEESALESSGGSASNERKRKHGRGGFARSTADGSVGSQRALARRGTLSPASVRAMLQAACEEDGADSQETDDFGSETAMDCAGATEGAVEGPPSVHVSPAARATRTPTSSAGKTSATPAQCSPAEHLYRLECPHRPATDHCEPDLLGLEDRAESPLHERVKKLARAGSPPTMTTHTDPHLSVLAGVLDDSCPIVAVGDDGAAEQMVPEADDECVDFATEMLAFSRGRASRATNRRQSSFLPLDALQDFAVVVQNSAEPQSIVDHTSTEDLGNMSEEALHAADKPPQGCQRSECTTSSPGRNEFVVGLAPDEMQVEVPYHTPEQNDRDCAQADRSAEPALCASQEAQQQVQEAELSSAEQEAIENFGRELDDILCDVSALGTAQSPYSAPSSPSSSPLDDADMLCFSPNVPPASSQPLAAILIPMMTAAGSPLESPAAALTSAARTPTTVTDTPLVGDTLVQRSSPIRSPFHTAVGAPASPFTVQPQASPQPVPSPAYAASPLSHQPPGNGASDRGILQESEMPCDTPAVCAEPNSSPAAHSESHSAPSVDPELVDASYVSEPENTSEAAESLVAETHSAILLDEESMEVAAAVCATEGNDTALMEAAGMCDDHVQTHKECEAADDLSTEMETPEPTCTEGVPDAADAAMFATIAPTVSNEVGHTEYAHVQVASPVPSTIAAYVICGTIDYHATIPADSDTSVDEGDDAVDECNVSMDDSILLYSENDPELEDFEMLESLVQQEYQNGALLDWEGLTSLPTRLPGADVSAGEMIPAACSKTAAKFGSPSGSPLPIHRDARSPTCADSAVSVDCGVTLFAEPITVCGVSSPAQLLGSPLFSNSVAPGPSSRRHSGIPRYAASPAATPSSAGAHMATPAHKASDYSPRSVCTPLLGSIISDAPTSSADCARATRSPAAVAQDGTVLCGAAISHAVVCSAPSAVKIAVDVPELQDLSTVAAQAQARYEERVAVAQWKQQWEVASAYAANAAIQRLRRKEQ